MVGWALNTLVLRRFSGTAWYELLIGGRLVLWLLLIGNFGAVFYQNLDPFVLRLLVRQAQNILLASQLFVYCAVGAWSCTPIRGSNPLDEQCASATHAATPLSGQILSRPRSPA